MSKPLFSPMDAERLIYLAALQASVPSLVTDENRSELQRLVIRLIDALYEALEAT